MVKSYPLTSYPECRFLYDSAVRIRDINNSTLTEIRKFRQNYGTSPFVCKLLWRELAPMLPKKYRQKHMLYALRFLKTYATEEVSAAVEGCDKKTFRESAWFFVHKLSCLTLVSTRVNFLMCNDFWRP